MLSVLRKGQSVGLSWGCWWYLRIMASRYGVPSLNYVVPLNIGESHIIPSGLLLLSTPIWLFNKQNPTFLPSSARSSCLILAFWFLRWWAFPTAQQISKWLWGVSRGWEWWTHEWRSRTRCRCWCWCWRLQVCDAQYQVCHTYCQLDTLSRWTLRGVSGYWKFTKKCSIWFQRPLFWRCSLIARVTEWYWNRGNYRESEDAKGCKFMFSATPYTLILLPSIYLLTLCPKITVAIGSEIRQSSALADDLNNSFDNTRVRLRGTMNRMLRMAARTGVGWRVWLLFFVVVFFLFAYVWLS